MKKLTLALLLCLLVLGGCGEDAETNTYVQVDRMGRPGVGLFLLRTVPLLNNYNLLAPAADITSLAAEERTEMNTIINLIGTYATSHSMSSVSFDAFSGGFLPDVVRIDTDIAFSGYTIDTVNVTSNGYLMLTGGRKLSEDVMDVMLSYLFNRDLAGTSITDGVTYNGPGVGVNPAQPGHQALLSEFPYLAAPN